MGRSSLALRHDLSVASSLCPLEFFPVSRCTDGLYSTQALPALDDDEGETRRFSGIPYTDGPVGHTGRGSLCRWTSGPYRKRFPMPMDWWVIQYSSLHTFISHLIPFKQPHLHHLPYLAPFNHYCKEKRKKRSSCLLSH